MKNFYNIVFALSLALFLSSCSYFNTEEAPEVRVLQAVEEPVLFQGSAGLSQEYAQRVIMKTGGSVQVFSLDDPGVSAPFAHSEGNIIVSTKSDPVVPSIDFKPITVEQENDPGVQIYEWGGESPIRSQFEPLSIRVSEEREPEEFVMIRSGDGKPMIVYFDHSSVYLDDEDMSKISKMAGLYNAGFMPEISVEGHASVRSNLDDPVQQRVVNLKISMDRAFAVAKALIESGVPADKIRTRAFVDRVSPKVSDGMNPESASRRVEVYER